MERRFNIQFDGNQEWIRAAIRFVRVRKELNVLPIIYIRIFKRYLTVSTNPRQSKYSGKPVKYIIPCPISPHWHPIPAQIYSNRLIRTLTKLRSVGFSALVLAPPSAENTPKCQYRGFEKSDVCQSCRITMVISQYRSRSTFMKFFSEYT